MDSPLVRMTLIVVIVVVAAAAVIIAVQYFLNNFWVLAGLAALLLALVSVAAYVRDKP